MLFHSLILRELRLSLFLGHYICFYFGMLHLRLYLEDDIFIYF